MTEESPRPTLTREESLARALAMDVFPNADGHKEQKQQP
jgi:hypothetical protein